LAASRIRCLLVVLVDSSVAETVSIFL
jgi:hypothetical protein